jgi:hypothetical protein
MTSDDITEGKEVPNPNEVQGTQTEPPKELAISDFHCQATCPKCGHGFWHKIGNVVIDVVEGIGNAVAQAHDLGGDS